MTLHRRFQVKYPYRVGAFPGRFAVIGTAFDSTPDQFTFTDQTGAPLSTLTESNEIIVTGLSQGVSVPITVTGGEYSKNGAAYTSLPGRVVNGDTVKARVTSSSLGSTSVNVVVTIG